MNEWKMQSALTLSLDEFAARVKEIGEASPQKFSARGWAYVLEGFGLCSKSDFDAVQDRVNDCRRSNLLPIDFVLEDEARAFHGVEEPDDSTPAEYIVSWLESTLNAPNNFTPDWWDDEKYYVQMLVEKIDLRELFRDVCAEYHVPIATSKGWSSMLQRARYARRFKEAEERGLKCVLLLCGDHDPDGLRITDAARSNLEELADIEWEDGESGYEPDDLTIERVGVNLDFIEANGLPWIDNLITGSGRRCSVCDRPLALDDVHHRNNKLAYVQRYLREIGVRKVEANALVRTAAVRENALALCRGAIEKYLGDDALERFRRKREKIRAVFTEFFDRTGLDDSIRTAIDDAGRSE